MARDQRITSRVGDDALRDATGRDWDGWLEVLDTAGARDWDHKAVVAHLEGEHPEVPTGWWRQTIAVGYEQVRGTRAVGQTSAGGFQVGVSRSVAASPTKVWRLLTSHPDRWLGGGPIDLTPGEPYDVTPAAALPGAQGEIRVVKARDRLRLTWQPDGWAAPATLQLALGTTSSGKTSITAHLEKLPDTATREEMRTHWRGVLDAIRAELDG